MKKKQLFYITEAGYACYKDKIEPELERIDNYVHNRNYMDSNRMNNASIKSKTKTASAQTIFIEENREEYTRNNQGKKKQK